MDAKKSKSNELSKLDDNALVAGYKDGNYACFDILLERHQAKVYGYLLTMVKDKELANDLFQETFFKVISTIQSGVYKDQNKFINWVMRIAHNLIVDYYRQQAKMPMVPNELPSAPGWELLDNINLQEGNRENDIIRQETGSSVRRLVKMLPPEQRRVVILRHYGKYDFKDIAKKTGVSINTALGRMRYAIINLRRLAKEHKSTIEL
ncbi:MAG: sigma-70 family RNA polymerase sigma factor [Bacteroidales bacterium]|nr:sigma-70 family RNA polymerase sigma factor [Bacteroidales bacterium]